MFGGRKAAFFLVSLAALCLLSLPVWPTKDTSSVGLRTEELKNTGALLGEGTREPKASPAGPASARDEPTPKNMTLTVPKLGLQGVAVPTGFRQEELDREGLLRIKESGLPWKAGSNTFIAGHALGFPRTRIPRAFHDLGTLAPGDEVALQTSDGRRYAFRVYDRMTVEPDDTWVMDPVEGKTVVSLQTCVPIPTFENRLIVRAELVS